ncbi:unnamed protein product [Lactuca saligna]|uniref:Uncharacterized protein n=1 Tax=Lactuca saligna TaxID=75948 RepID=A0AA36EAH7_LACSI|nr:unnamed protein product [Lactuca saligna]
MRSWRSKTPLTWVQCCRIINVSLPNNQHIYVVANPTELMLLFYVCYVNWTLNHEESSPRSCIKEKDEPDTGFGEEKEEEEETYYHGTQLNHDDLGSHGLEGEIRYTPTHVELSLDVGEHHTKTMTLIGRPHRKRGVP